METRIGRWGNSLAVRIPRALAREAQLEAGLTVEIGVSGGRLIVAPLRRRYSLAQLANAITEDNRHVETSWGEPVGSEA